VDCKKTYQYTHNQKGRCLPWQHAHLVVMNEFVHAPGPKRGAHSVCESHASVDIADKLWCALAGVCSLFQQDDLGLLQAKMQVIHVSASGSQTSCFQAPLHHSLMVAFKSILTIPIIGIMLAAVGC
jgi:hypothetical protein